MFPELKSAFVERCTSYVVAFAAVFQLRDTDVIPAGLPESIMSFVVAISVVRRLLITTISLSSSLLYLIVHDRHEAPVSQS